MKNSLFGAFCSAITCIGYHRTTSHEHLTVGHTHEDVGALTAGLAVPSGLPSNRFHLFSTEMPISVYFVDSSEKEMNLCGGPQDLIMSLQSL